MFRTTLAAMLLLLASATLSTAATVGDVLRASAGVNAVWLDGPGTQFPADVEAAGQASASLSPHLSLVSSLGYGFSHSYFRWDGGARVTATDVNNPNFNVYLGIRYRGGSIAAVQPNEWAPDAGVAWKPNPTAWPNFVVGADAGYGLQSNRVLTYLALRYLLPIR